MNNLKPLKIDRTKLITPQNYAKKHLLSPSTVYRYMAQGKLKTEEIDGVQFVVVP